MCPVNIALDPELNGEDMNEDLSKGNLAEAK